MRRICSEAYSRFDATVTEGWAKLRMGKSSSHPDQSAGGDGNPIHYGGEDDSLVTHIDPWLFNYASQANSFGTDGKNEVALTVLHEMLHVEGYNHTPTYPPYSDAPFKFMMSKSDLQQTGLPQSQLSPCIRW
jgi:hypothetical protein